jgi:hypothetical protein
MFSFIKESAFPIVEKKERKKKVRFNVIKPR